MRDPLSGCKPIAAAGACRIAYTGMTCAPSTCRTSTAKVTYQDSNGNEISLGASRG